MSRFDLDAVESRQLTIPALTKSKSLFSHPLGHAVTTKQLGKARKYNLAAADLSTGRPELGVPTLTVGQIAEQLRTAAPDMGATTERIKHWTREGFLLPVEQHHAGTGKHRRYDPLSVLDAAVLNVMADAGLRMAGHRHLLDALALARRAHESWSAASRASRFLEISHLKNRGWTFALHENAVAPNPTAELSVLINLTRIFLDIDASERITAPTANKSVD